MDRRNFLSAAPAFSFGALMASGATAAVPTDPLRSWFEDWQTLRAEWNGNGHDEDGEQSAYGEALWSRADGLEEKLATTKATTADGALAQLEWMLADSTDMDFQTGHREALELAHEALKALVA
ncbi:hypothetical protein [Pseudodonghicola flavimaris]|uniref:Uncharacterized protein n=1 Tax=Pseudodonghicola flavimaris TaxID=3050036 RepID=A0ABT7F822_9RHOB|nr:hypothetical protein [Pseudodonghicola flavimaris]MDK3020760.1 hypothetical protein [Pseudodonghicola flavimaris]